MTENRTESDRAAQGGVSLRLPKDDRPERGLQRRSLHHLVTERLRDMIVENELKPGERVDEKALCDLFEISRTPLREALKVLASEGLVELLPNRGARVTEMTEREIIEIFEVASCLERMAAELSAERSTDKELADLRRTHDSMMRHHESGRRSDYFRLNHRIHNMLIQFARNSVLSEHHTVLMTRIRRARFQAIMSQERWDESMAEHEELMTALEARDGPRAGEIMRAHVLETGEAIRKPAPDSSGASGAAA